jgi:hypothetical protein
MCRRFAVSALVLSALAMVGVLPAVAQAPADTAAAPAAADTAAAPAPVDTAAAAKPEEVKPPAVLYEKAKVVVDGKAEANGTISFLFIPEGGKAAIFSVDVLKDTKKDDVAKAIHTKLTIAAGEQYKVKVSGGEVKVERAKKEYPKFSVSVEETKLPGVSVLVKKG